MNSNILVVVLLAYFLDNVLVATFQPFKTTSLDRKNTPAQIKSTLVSPVLGNFKVNPVVLAPRTASSAPAPPGPPPSPTFLPSFKKGNPQPLFILPKSGIHSASVKSDKEDTTEKNNLKVSQVEPSPLKNIPLKSEFSNGNNKVQVSRTSTSTTVPTNGNGSHQGFEVGEEGDDDYEEEEYEEVEEEEEEEEEEHLENSKTVESPTQSKPTISINNNNNSNKFQISQPMLSSSTSKPTLPETVKQESYDHQGLEIPEDELEEEIEDEDYEDPLENSKTVISQPMLSSSTTKPTLPETVKQEDYNQGFDKLEDGDDYEEEYDYEEVSEENEYNHNGEEYLEDPNHNTQTDDIITNGVQVNPSVQINDPIITVPQLSEDELKENNSNESEYSFYADEDHIPNQNYVEWESDSSYINNKFADISKTLDGKNDNTNNQAINSNEFESNPYDNTQILSDEQEENKERVINGYEATKKLLYMLHDYASSAFNWIINKINYQIEQLSS